MNITMYTFSKKNNSTEQPSGAGDQISCVLKENCSILSPVFILKSNNFSYNYCKWDNRYYFVNDIVSLANNYTEYHCSVDALASWKADIGTRTEYILRCASQSDGYIPDMLYPLKAKPTETKLVSTTISSAFQGSSFVLGVVNNDNVNTGAGAVKYYSLSDTQMRSLLHDMLDTPSYMNISADEISEDLTKALVDPFQYIKSCTWYPFNVGGTVASGHIKFGWWESNTNANFVIDNSDRIKTFTENFTIPQHPQAAARGKYLNGSPFRRMSGICYNFGQYIINPTYFIEGGNLGMTIDVDLYANQGILKISDVAGHVVHQLYAPVGVEIPVAQMSVNHLNTGIDMLGAAGSLITGNVVGYAQGLASAIQDMIPQSKSSGADGSKAAYQMAPTILIEDYLAAADSNMHNGRPLCMDKMINTLSGYIVVDNPDVDIPCTEQERDIIMSAMTSGFYYE